LRDYRRYVIGWLTVLVATQMQSVALQWEIYDRTGQPFALAMVGLMQIIPALALILPAGHYADAHDRRYVIALGMIGTTLTSLALAGASLMDAPVSAFYALLLLDATFLTMARPARSSILPLIVPEKIFPNAVAWNSSMMQMGLMVGPALGGLIIAALKPAAAYVISACGSMLFAVLILRMSIRRPAHKREPMSVATLLGGARFVWGSRLVLAAIVLDMFAVLFGGAVYLLPIYARDILDVGEWGFGLLRAAPAAGACVTAMIVAHLPPMKHAGRNLLLAVVGFGIATIVFGLSQWFWLSLAMLALTGATDNVSVVIRHTLVQMATPDEKRGRVSAVNSVFISTSNELGGFESGAVAQLLGPVVAVVSGGVGTLIVVAVTAWRAPMLRRLGRLDDIKAEGVRP
jgi:MFS family permease